MTRSCLCSRAGALLAASACLASADAQLRFLLADRDSDAIWIMTDRNGNGMIDEPAELALFYSAANAAGTPGPLNPNTLSATLFGEVIYGDADAGARHWIVLRDRDFNGDAQGEGESRIGASPANASGAVFAAPNGFATLEDEFVYLCTAGNASGPDQIFRGQDLTDDGDIDDEGEIAGYVTINGFGTNGSFSPAEIAFGADGALYLRNSSAAGQGIFRLRDADASGFIDDAAEFVVWFGASNLAGTPASAGFALEPDPLRERAFYTLQIASGGNDQLVRGEDRNADNDALDEMESSIVFSTAEAGFNAVDVLALSDGRVLVSDTSGPRIIALVDLDGDGAFTSTGERSTLFANTSGMVAAARGLALFPCPGDFNRDLTTDADDLGDFINCYFATPSCDRADFNDDANVDADDLGDFINVYFTPC
ncbi:MAG: hypothetical protein AB7K52_09560 [Phycisphaerales bacterium]